jgi:FAD/FMN-containing dehydrogenase
MNRRRFFQGSLAASAAASLPGNRVYAAILSSSMQVDADIDAVTGDGASVTLSKASVQELGESLRGNLLLPGHPAYEEARRVLNPSIDKRPALIVQPKGSADVKNAVDFARGSNLLVAVKCGGHSLSGKSTCDGGMMIDLSTLRSVRIDPAARIAHVSGGSLLGDMDHDTMAFGLVATAGTVSHTGVGGLTLGGGFGRVARRFGLALDNVRGVDIVNCRRPTSTCRRRRELRSLLGRARRRRQFRRRDPVRVRVASDGPPSHRR